MSTAEQRLKCLQILKASLPEQLANSHTWCSCMSAPEFDFQLINAYAGYVVAAIMIQNETCVQAFAVYPDGGRSPTGQVEGTDLEDSCIKAANTAYTLVFNGDDYNNIPPWPGPRVA